MNNFFIIGAQRSGSSLLAEILDSSLNIEMAKPIRPEPKYFLDDLGNKKFSEIKIQYEQKFFKKLSKCVTHFGEKSTSYIESHRAAKNIKTIYPEAKIVAILRDPVTRAVSNYYFSMQNGLENEQFEDALSLEKERIKLPNKQTSVSPFAYITRGYYMNHISAYERIFGHENIKICIFEKLISEEKYLNSLTSWLGVPDIPRYERILSRKINRSLRTQQQNISVLKEIGEKYKNSIKELEAFIKADLDIWTKNKWY